MESGNDGEIPMLVQDTADWLSMWFEEIRCCRPIDVDEERLTWIRCYGVPPLVWSVDFLSTSYPWL